jgi:Fe-S cluster biogenesis protein NfuA
MDDRAWRAHVESIVRAMVQPLVADGGRFVIETCDPSTKQIVVRASMADCEECTMSDEALAQLLEEAVQRTDPDAQLSVVSQGR